MADIYERVADGESLQSVANLYDTWPQSIKILIRFEANHTGIVRCSWSDLAWAHKVQPVVESALWWRANKVLSANSTSHRANRGGRPVARPANWLSGLLECPECGGKLFVNTGTTPAGNPRTPKLRCGGLAKTRRACGRYTAVDASLVVAELDRWFGSDETQIMSFQRTDGNAHELDELKASLTTLQARLGTVDDDDELDALVAQRKALKTMITEFVIIPDSYGFAPTGQTIADMWNESDDNKRRIVKAVVGSIGLGITPEWDLDEHNLWLHTMPSERVIDGIVDLGDGICFKAVAD